MGLDVRAGKLSYRIGAYSYFGNWRNTVFQLITNNENRLNQFIGFGGKDPKALDLDFFFINDKSIRDVYRPLRYLINHSDSDGIITLSEARELLPALKTFVEEFYDGRQLSSIINSGKYDKDIPGETLIDLKSLITTTVEFINLCAACIKYKDNMEFG